MIEILQNVIRSLMDYNMPLLYITNYESEYFEDGCISSMYISDNVLYIKGKSKLSTDDEEECFEIIDILEEGFKLEVKENKIIINDIVINIGEISC